MKAIQCFPRMFTITSSSARIAGVSNLVSGASPRDNAPLDVDGRTVLSTGSSAAAQRRPTATSPRRFVMIWASYCYSYKSCSYRTFWATVCKKTWA